MCSQNSSYLKAPFFWVTSGVLSFHDAMETEVMQGQTAVNQFSEFTKYGHSTCALTPRSEEMLDEDKQCQDVEVSGGQEARVQRGVR